MTAPKFEKLADRLYYAEVRVSVRTAYGKARLQTLHLRLDGREGNLYRVDQTTIGIWEAIDGGRESAPSNLRDAKKLVREHLARVVEQGTVLPRNQ